MNGDAVPADGSDAARSTRWIRVAGVLGGLGVGLGAFGAHGLRERLSPAALEIYKTGVLYHLIHAVALLALALAPERAGLGGKVTRGLFALGILIFSGSLYALALTGVRWLGAVTPIGGVLFIAGWLTLVMSPRR